MSQLPSDENQPAGCLGCVVLLGMLSALAYAALSWLGVAVPGWVLWADALTFAVLLVLAWRVGGLTLNGGASDRGEGPKEAGGD